jgi:hypothetical protein
MAYLRALGDPGHWEVRAQVQDKSGGWHWCRITVPLRTREQARALARRCGYQITAATLDDDGIIQLQWRAKPTVDILTQLVTRNYVMEWVAF